MNRSLIAFLVIFLVGATGCSETTAPKADLEARLSLSLVEFENENPLSVRLVFDPSVSISRLGPVDSLRVRWDMNGDREWDVDFRSMQRWDDFRKTPVPFKTWSASIEVVDRFGNSSVTARTIKLPDHFPESPDLVAGKMIVTRGNGSRANTDTLSVNSEFFLILPARYWGNRNTVECRFTCTIDSQFVKSSRNRVQGPWVDYGNTGIIGPLVVAEAGVHEIEVEAQLLWGVEEDNMANNWYKRSVVFIGGGGN